MRFAIALVLLGFSATWPRVHAQSADPQLQQRTFPDFTGKPLEPRCAAISDLGPKFEPLVNACQYALSPEDLPNLVCHKSIERDVRGYPLDKIEAEVRTVNGIESYTQVSADGAGPVSTNWSGGWGSDALFSRVLTAVFFAKTKTKFTLAKDSSTTDTGFDHYDFSYMRNYGPGFDLGGESPPMTGSIWINRKTGRLAQLETVAHPVPPKTRVQSYHSVIVYNFVPIMPLGLVLVPVKADVQACVGSTCFRNAVTFHDCQKFGAQVKIDPAPPQ
jgi:hypothetical protein